MSVDDMKNQAVIACVDIFREYEEPEVNNHYHPTVIKAWYVGKSICDHFQKENEEQLKTFTL